MAATALKKALAELKNYTGVTTLDIGGNETGDQGAGRLATALEHNTGVTTLDLGGNAIGDQGAREVFGFQVGLDSNYFPLVWIPSWFGFQLFSVGLDSKLVWIPSFFQVGLACNLQGAWFPSFFRCSCELPR
eukprot:gnl/TRDRNA2_/TRDRNA2_171642_c3_seq1.p2 gnl/TRDRNA2_/TRDRNA2_171642_c3~~gnl/TRDRNA2_/TRDRNA2_171642_c3_seq1.p2  ORF type:complete len:132 (-),score=8.84 gnl/TRDRNA2_/TRDRNA2_171642_c3_seq1:113-508(-)